MQVIFCLFFTDDIKQIEDLYSSKMKNLLSVCFVGPISIGAFLKLKLDFGAKHPNFWNNQYYIYINLCKKE